MNGVLYLVGVPIGNYEDISLRAIRVLKEVDLVLAEDTRKTGLLFQSLQITTKKTSYHEHNKLNKTKDIIDLLHNGQNIALVTDAGMPGIADPGAFLVKEAYLANISIKVIPGPSSLTTAFSLSGAQNTELVFLGFLPKKELAKQKLLQKYLALDINIIFFESPYRLLKTLALLSIIAPENDLCLTRELTKTYEEILYLKATEAIMRFKKQAPKGEFTIVIKQKN